MLYGLAAFPEYLGPNFFKTYNDFNFNSTTSSTNLQKDKVFLQNYPNPFSNQTLVQFEVEKPSNVIIDIITIDGQNIRQLVNKDMTSGRHSVQWDIRNGQNMQVPPGVYICRMLIDSQLVQIVKLSIVK